MIYKPLFLNMLARTVGRPLLLLAALAAAPATGQAQHATAVVTVNGQSTTRALARITFDGDNVVLHFDDGTDDKSLDLSAVTITLPEATAIRSATILSTAVVARDAITIDGIAQGTRVTLYDATGRPLLQTTAPAATLTLPTAQLRPGVYVVRAGGTIIKFGKH